MRWAHCHYLCRFLLSLSIFYEGASMTQKLSQFTHVRDLDCIPAVTYIIFGVRKGIWPKSTPMLQQKLHFTRGNVQKLTRQWREGFGLNHWRRHNEMPNTWKVDTEDRWPLLQSTVGSRVCVDLPVAKNEFSSFCNCQNLMITTTCWFLSAILWLKV